MFRITIDEHKIIEDRITFRQYSWRRLTGSVGMRLRLNKTERIFLYLLTADCEFKELTNMLDGAFKKIETKMEVSLMPKYIGRLNFILTIKNALTRGIMGLR